MFNRTEYFNVPEATATVSRFAPRMPTGTPTQRRFIVRVFDRNPLDDARIVIETGRRAIIKKQTKTRIMNENRTEPLPSGNHSGIKPVLPSGTSASLRANARSQSGDYVRFFFFFLRNETSKRLLRRDCNYTIYTRLQVLGTRCFLGT